MYANLQSGQRGTSSAARAYAQVGIESSVLSASPHTLMTLLFDASIAAVSMSRRFMEAGDIQQKGKSISRAINLIQNGLLASLDRDAVGANGIELVDNLESLYSYMLQCLMLANLRNDPAKLDEVERLLENVASAWREIGPLVADK